MKIRHRGWRRASSPLPLLLLAACAPGPKQAPPSIPTVAPAPPVPPPPSPRSVWRASGLPPQITQASFVQPTAEGLLLIDDSGARWLFPRDGSPPRSVDVLDALPLAKWRWDDALGLVAISGDGRVRTSKTALGPLLPFATLPEGADAETFATLDGLRTVRAKGGILSSRDGLTWAPVPGFAGYDPLQIVLDPRGHGVGLFAPETVAITKDAGATWTPLPTAALSVTSLATFEGRPVLAPAGRSDHFQRSVDLDTSAIDRVFMPSELSPAEKRAAAVSRGVVITPKGHALEYRRAREPSAPSAAAPSTAALAPVRLDLAADEYDAVLASTDGDRVLAVPSNGLRLRHPGTLPLVGKLGEGGVPLGGEALAGCRLLSGALCGDLVALSCSTEIVVYRKDKQVARFPSTLETAIGFDAQARLLSFSLDRSGYRGTLRRYDLDAVPPKSSVLPVGEIPVRSPAFVGGCHKPALWLVGEGAAARWEGEAFGTPEKMPDRVVPVGVNHERELVVTTPVARAITFVPSGRKVEIGDASRGSISFTEDGRHALVAHLPRRLLASSDGGHAFRAIPAPSAWNSVVLCGKDRCQLGMGAYRDGFEEDETFVPLPSTLPAADPPPPSLPPPKSLPTVMKCAVDPDAFRGVPVASGGLSPRVGSAAFSGLGTEGAPRRQAIFGDVGGHAKVFALPPEKRQRPDGDDDEEGFAAGGVAIARRTGGPRAARVAIEYRWDASSPLWRFLDHDTWRTALASPDLFSEGGLATHYHPGRLLVWGSKAPTERSYPTRARRGGVGVFAEDAAGTLRVVHEAGETALSLVVAPREGVAVDRSLIVRRHEVRENALGLLPPASADAPWSLVVSELVADDTTELRIHPLGPDLSLGPPVVVPGTRGPADQLMDLPSCGPNPTGALVRTFTKERVSIDEAGQLAKGYLQRFLRASSHGACVERTFLADRRTDLTGGVVVVGNGGIGSSRRHAGLRCEPVTTTLPRPQTD